MCKYASKIRFWYGKIVTEDTLLKYIQTYFDNKYSDIFDYIDAWKKSDNPLFEIAEVPRDFIDEVSTYIVGYTFSSILYFNEKMSRFPKFPKSEGMFIKQKFKSLKLPMKSYKPEYGKKYGAGYYNFADGTCE